jgi:hypothetical protein
VYDEIVRGEKDVLALRLAGVSEDDRDCAGRRLSRRRDGACDASHRGCGGWSVGRSQQNGERCLRRPRRKMLSARVLVSELVGWSD